MEFDTVAEALAFEYPEATTKPCNECPWRREAAPGHLGPHTAEEWAAAIHTEVAIACHKTIESDGEWEGSIRQCAGAAQVRTNVHKLPMNPTVARAPEVDASVCFRDTREFVTHHNRERS